METRASKKMKQRDALQKNKSKKKRNTIAKSMITTRSSKKEQLLSPTADDNNSNDRISDLPEELLHRIFSFLPIKSTAQTTVLSKRWNHLSLWRTHFSPLSPNPPHISGLSHQFQSPTDFIPIVLSRRQQDSNINTFRFFGNILGDIDCAGGFPCSFSNLTTLKLHTNMTKDEITGIICLLRSSPILHTITISVNDCSDTRYESWDEEQCLESQSRTLESLEHHLKVVRIHIQYTTVLMTRHKTTLNFVEFLLRHGKVLQEITLTSNSSRWDCSIQRPNILWKMKFPRASSVVNASVAYQM